MYVNMVCKKIGFKVLNHCHVFVLKYVGYDIFMYFREKPTQLDTVLLDVFSSATKYQVLNNKQNIPCAVRQPI